MKSAPYRLEGKLFRYDFSDSTVEYIAKAAAEDIAFDRYWAQTHGGESLMGIGTDGYMILDTVGLHRRNWENKESRDGYLLGWSDDIDAESARLASDFVRYEFMYST